MATLLQNNLIPPSPQAQIPSKEEVLKRVVNRIENLSKESFNQLIRTQREGIDAVWNHPRLTPQEVIDELGDKAIKVFQFHGGLTEYIKTIAAIDGVQVELKYPTNAFTIDPKTGKITVTEDPYTP